MKSKQSKVTLISHTHNPLRTVWDLWWSSKGDKPLKMIQQEYDEIQAIGLFTKIISMNIPIAENIQFVFVLENVSISFREQMVRHRIGVQCGDNYGVDIVPDLAKSSWWSQSMRIKNMNNFANNCDYRIPANLDKDEEEQWKNDMTYIQHIYDYWSKIVPIEDAREFIPLGVYHRISWSLNLAALQHIVGKRMCWILQGGYWLPIINQMIAELVSKIHPVFELLAEPPCISGDTFGGCDYEHENERRVEGADCHHACPLWLKYEQMSEPTESDYKKRKTQYYKMWRYKNDIAND